MEKTTELKVLLEKFRQGIASPDELQSLYRMLNASDRTEFETLISNEWADVPFTNGELDSLALLDTIRKKSGIGSKEEEPKMITQKRWQVKYITFMRYAAIFIFAIGLTWFLKPSAGKVVLKTQPQFFNIKVAYGSKTTIELPDSSVVVLNSGSTLSYPDKFEAESRTVKLVGEAFFEVKKNSKRPFYVKTKDVTIRVLGTKFNVKSYPDDNTSETTLVSGSVEIMQNSQGNRKTAEPIFLKPNQKAIFTRTSGLTELKDLNKEQAKDKVQAESESSDHLFSKIADQDQEETDIDIAWRNNKLILNNDRFGDIIKILERWYDVEINIQNPALEDVRFSAKFDKESIVDVLNALKIIEPFHYDISKNVITIRKNN